jgi:HEAT repeat protein
MENSDVKQKALDALIVVNTAIKNMRLYPANSTKVVNIVDRLHNAFLDMLKEKAPLVFERSKNGVLFCGEPLADKNEEKWQVSAFAKILAELNIENAFFEQELSKEELSRFLEILAKKPDNLQGDDSLQKLLKQKNISHVLFNKKDGLANNSLLSPDDLANDKIINFFIRTSRKADDDIQKIEQVAEKTDYLLQIFNSRLADIMKQNNVLPAEKISENLTDMLSFMSKITNSLDKNEQDKISQEIGKSVSLLEPSVKNILKKQMAPNLFRGSLTQYFEDETAGIEEEQIKQEAVKVVFYQEEEKIIENIIEKKAQGTKAATPSPATQLKENLQPFLDGDDSAFTNTSLMSSLPELFRQLNTEKEHETMALLISKLANNLSAKNEQQRSLSAGVLADVLDSLSTERKTKLIERLSARLTNWIKSETLSSAAYKKICENLKDLIENFIQDTRFVEALPILDAFSSISTGLIEKNDKAHEISLNIIRSLASENNISALLKIFNRYKNNPEIQHEAGSVLVRLGDTAMNRLLDILQAKTDSDERVRIMKLFMGLGSRAIPAVRERLIKPAPWYYLRNMAYILGHIGNEASAEALKHLLTNENQQLRNEALKSIYKTGGAKRGALLLEALPQADDQFKIEIIEALGNAKSVEAVPELIKMLEERNVVDASFRDELEEKICVALGSIGSPEALPLLKKISGATFSLGLSRYSKKAKLAASIAVISINNKLEGTQKKAEAEKQINDEKTPVELNIPLDEVKDNTKSKKI